MITSLRRPITSSWPRTAATSKIPGETVVPVRAARNGCAILPNLISSFSAKAWTASFITSSDHWFSSAKFIASRLIRSCASEFNDFAAFWSTFKGRGKNKIKKFQLVRELSWHVISVRALLGLGVHSSLNQKVGGLPLQ